MSAVDMPEHPVDSRWLLEGTDDAGPELFVVVKVTKNTVTMRHVDEGWTIKFHEKHRAFESGKLVRQ